MSERRHRIELPDDMPTVRDPHHNGSCRWGWSEGKLWHWDGMHPAKWDEVSNISFTPARLRAIASIIPNTNPERREAGGEEEEDDG